MKQGPLIAFESSAFPISPGEDERTNPGIFGRALAEWLSARLRAAGWSTREVIAEDFGWCIPVDSTAHALYVACAGGGREAEDAPTWRVFVFAEGGILARLVGRDTGAASVRALSDAVRGCLEASGEIRGLREERG